MEEKFKFLLKKNINKLPKKAGVYCFKNEEIFYIGKASNIKERVKNHFQNPSFKDYLFLEKVKKIGYIETGSQIEALILEAKLIKKIKPKFNVFWKDDKNYFFVAKTQEDFPRVFITHQVKLKEKKIFSKNDFVGPFVDGKALKKTLKILRKIFPFRSCRQIPKRPCLWYHLQRCPAPCILKSKSFQKISKVSKIKKITKRNAQKIIKFLKKGEIPLLKELKKEMKKLAQKQKFEEAAKIRDQIFALEKIKEHSKIFSEEINSPHLNWPEIEEKLKKILNFKRKISKIEAFDVSNIKGKMATGSMITFINGRPEKKLYRKFKIRFEKKPNDISMLKEILERRLKHPEWGLPDLILVDGGKGQLRAAIEIKNKNLRIRNKIKILSLAKKKKELFIEKRKEPIFLEKLPSEIFNLILRLNKEAHRFALSYHRKLREKVMKG